MKAFMSKAGVYDWRFAAPTTAPLRIETIEGWRRLVAHCLQENVSRVKKEGWVIWFGEVADGCTEEKFGASALHRCTAVVVDYDKGMGPMSFVEFTDKVSHALPGLRYIWWETYQSTKEVRRFRLVYPLASAIPQRDKSDLWSWVTAQLSAGGLPAPDRSSRGGASIHHLPIMAYGAGVEDGRELSYEDMPAGVRTVANDTEDEGKKAASGKLALVSLPQSTKIELESGECLELGAVTQEKLEAGRRSSEDKVRCTCPEDPSDSHSAFVWIVRGKVRVQCMAESHTHSAGQQWGCMQYSTAGGVEESHMPFPYKVSGNRLMCEKQKGDGTYEETVCSQVPIVTMLYLDDETGDEWWKTEWDGIHGRTTCVLRRDEVASAQKLCERAGRQGMDLHEGNKKEMTKYLSEYVSHNGHRLPRQSVTSRLGWFKEGFMWGSTWMCLDGSGMERELVMRGGDGSDQLAHGFRSDGDFASWVRGLQLLKPYPLVMAGVFASVASCLLPMCDTLSCVFEWAATAGTGKTASMRLAESVWGKPREIESSWDLTRVGMEQRASFLSCLPLFLDDTKTQSHGRNTIDPEWAIYRAVSGEGRVRGQPGGGTKATQKWALNMFSTGEEPLYGMTQSGGARARMISLQDAPFGRGPKEDVKSVVAPPSLLMCSNHGWAGPAVVRQVYSAGPVKVRSIYQKYREFWAGRLHEAEHSAGDRLSIHMGMLHAAAVILLGTIRKETGIDPGIDPAVVLQVIATHLSSVDSIAGEVDPSIRSQLEFYSWCAQRRTRFWASGLERSSHECLGRWDGDANWEEYAVSPGAITDFLKGSGYSFSVRQLVAKWADLGFVKRSTSGRLTHTVRYNGSKDELYVIPRLAVDALLGYNKGEVHTENKLMQDLAEEF